MLVVELFALSDRWLANEMACRVHNSFHWTIEGAVTSQFENHVRAVAGFPLGDTTVRGYAAMLNLVGSLPDLSALANEPGISVHDYGKEPRAGRKLGHVTVVAATRDEIELRIGRVLALAGDRARDTGARR